MFQKFLNDLEGEVKLAGRKFKPAIKPPYRWRDWAAQWGAVKARFEQGLLGHNAQP